MSYTHRNGEITLFRTKNKKSEKSPDYTGTGKALDGTPVEVAGWLKGKEPQFISCVVKVKSQQAQQSAPAPLGPDDEVPF